MKKRRKNMPKVSILVPVYNVEKYLRECLDSLVKQTLQDIEIICINDGSTDSSLEILQDYQVKDSRIKIINKTNSGYGASMNIGLNIASGEYIGIVESDDFIDCKMFEDLYEIATYNNADIVKSDFYFYTTSNKRARKAGKIAKNKCGKPFNVKDDYKILKIMPSIWSAIYKKDFLNMNNIRFLETSGASYQDTSFAFKTLSTAERIVFTDKAYLYYRQDNENSSVQSKGKVFAICDEWEEITNYINARPEIKTLVNDIKLLTEFNAYRWNTIRIDERFRGEFIDKYQKIFKQYVENKEIEQGFYRKNNKAELEMLLTNKEAYRNFVDKLAVKQKQKENRRQMFSFRVNPSRVSLICFGKQLLEV